MRRRRFTLARTKQVTVPGWKRPVKKVVPK
jgi:hypothetical protein